MYQQCWYALILIVLQTITSSVVASNIASVVTEVSVGDTAILDCPSNDDNHRFQFWKLHSNEIVGPGSIINQAKYKYDVLTGALYVKSVSIKDHGEYTCISRNLTGPTFSAGSVELVVKKDWEEDFETDHSTNVFRLVALFAVATILVVLLFIVYNYRRDRSHLFRDLVDEESPDENEPGPSLQPGSPRIVVNQSLIDTSGIDTEFPKEFTTSIQMAVKSKM